MKCEMKGCGVEVEKPLEYKGKKLCRPCWEEWQVPDEMKGDKQQNLQTKI